MVVVFLQISPCAPRLTYVLCLLLVINCLFCFQPDIKSIWFLHMGNFCICVCFLLLRVFYTTTQLKTQPPRSTLHFLSISPSGQDLYFSLRFYHSSFSSLCFEMRNLMENYVQKGSRNNFFSLFPTIIKR